jgi:hypothetical protein
MYFREPETVIDPAMEDHGELLEGPIGDVAEMEEKVDSALNDDENPNLEDPAVK